MDRQRYKEIVDALVIGTFIALVAYGVASAGLGIASFFVVPAIAAPFVIARLRRGRGQEQEIRPRRPA